MGHRGRLGAVLRRGRVSLVCALLLASGVSLFRRDVSTAPRPFLPLSATSTSFIARLPLAFEPNLGQSGPEVKFLSHSRGYSLFLTSTQAVLAFPLQRESKGKEKESAAVGMQFAGANTAAMVAGTELLPGHSNYFIGNDRSRWLRNVAQFSRVRYQSLYSGIDLDFYGREGRLEYDFRVAPGADPRQIGLQFNGTDAIHISKNGDLVLATAGRELRFQAPQIYQLAGDREEPVSGGFVLSADGHVGFQVGEYDRTRMLVIDPVLAYSTYLGGSGAESCAAITGASAGFVPHCPAIAIDSASRVYIAGATTSPGNSFPGAGAGLTLNGTADVFVSRISSSGTGLAVDYVTYLGATGTQYPTGIGVDSGFNVYVTGNTDSAQFPTVNGLPGSPSGNHAFLGKLDSGANLVYSTYLAGSGSDSASDLAVDSQARAYVFGITSSTDFPVTPGALQPQYPSGAANQFFFAKVDPAQTGSNSLLYSTFFGGSTPNSGSVMGGAIAVDSLSNVYLAGGTTFDNMPVVNAYQGTIKGGSDIWAAKLKAPATNTQQYSLVYETYLGGSGNDVAYGVASDGTNTFVTGSTSSIDITLPTGITPFQGTNGGVQDAFVAKFGVPTTTGTTQGSVPLNYFSYLGGNLLDAGLAITADASQNVRVTGLTQSGGTFPNTNPLPNVSGGGTDAFAARIATSSGVASATSILGGSGTDIGTSIATDVTLNSYIGGETSSGDFPAAASAGQPPITPVQAALSGSSDAFISKLGPTITGVTLTCPGTVTTCNPTGAGASPSPQGVGSAVTFTYPIYNTGDPVNGAVFTATVQGTNSTITSASASSGSCTTTTSTAVCNLGILGTSTITTSGSNTTLAFAGKVTITATAIAPSTPLSTTSSIGNSGVLTLAGTTFQSTLGQQAQINDFVISATPASQSVTAGNQATYVVTVTPTGVIPASVSLSTCSNLPAGANCVYSGNPIPNLSSGAQNRTLEITTTPRVTTPASLFHKSSSFYALWFPISGLALIGAGATRRRRWLMGAFVACTLLAMLLQAGCSSSSSNNQTTTGTPAGTYTVVLNATSGSATRSTSVTLTVK
jgi:hypothetical protein